MGRGELKACRGPEPGDIDDLGLHRGSNDLIVGSNNGWSGYGEVIGGESNQTSGPFATAFGVSTSARGTGSLTAGHANVASGVEASATGGSNNTASKSESSISGGAENTATGQVSSIAGGYYNTATVDEASILGGC